MKKVLVLVLVSFVMMAGTAMAENYVTGKFGLYMPTDSDLESGTVFEVAYGMDIEDMIGSPLIGEVAYGYYSADLDVTGVDGDVTMGGLTAAVLYPMDMDAFELRVGGGFGMYFWEVDAESGGFSFSDDGTEFGFFGQADAVFELNDQVGLIAGAKYSIVDADGTDAGGLSINAGVQYNF